MEAALPFNGSGSFSVVNTFVAGTTILSSAVNQNFSDIATNGLTNAVTRDGQGVMSAPFKLTSGSAAAPSLAFQSDAQSGIYLAGTSQVGLSVGGALKLLLTSSAITPSAPIGMQAQASVASATTTDIGAENSNNVLITGTTTITGLGTAAAGVWRLVQFGGALTLTHNGTSLILPGGNNITTAAGDTSLFVSLGSGNWRCWFYGRASGAPVLIDADTIPLNALENTTRGDIAYAGASGVWANLAAGTDGQFLATNGASGDPAWEWSPYIQTVYAEETATTSTSSSIPVDNSVPSSGEGVEALSASITPSSTAHDVLVSGFLMVGGTTNARVVASIFRGTSCIGVSAIQMADSFPQAIPFQILDSPSTTSSTTYSVRFGTSGGSVQLNGSGSGRIFGGASRCVLTLQELR